VAFNAGGALADISWLEAGDVPIIGFHCENDQYAPIDTGDVIVPTTGDFVVEVMGSRTIAHYSNVYGNNDIFVQAGFTDDFTVEANTNNSGYEGLYVFKTPAPSATPNAFGQFEEEWGAPWDWWDNTTYGIQAQAVNGTSNTSPAFFEANSILGNPDMSATKARAYIDTIQGYLNPRLYIAFGFAFTPAEVNNVIDFSTEIYPNPAKNSLNVVSYASKINTISLHNLNGQEVLNTAVNANKIKLNLTKLEAGIYIVNIKSNDTTVKRKVTIQ